MFPLDSIKTAFITSIGMYYYNVMSFGLKNAEETYQRMMACMFESLLVKTMEVNIDEIKVLDGPLVAVEAFKVMRVH